MTMLAFSFAALASAALIDIFGRMRMQRMMRRHVDAVMNMAGAH
jgi:hypothetical protein